ncbi:hypothetical protein HanXRQr2_Chr07g0285871 [Helianthus annuus]|uniref:Uncharacterized protein n=1 Tax=Helianthus annuus TaxID=4232 RepID=A0A251T7F6_HELAN|nr:hypothetical protein HanXRQr2_Chr07g0285871 [Helianthus annuus]KAJ0904002.1 hypothetical protein HanPSC8_Chr07g0276731 [Helianthus annuus]
MVLCRQIRRLQINPCFVPTFNHRSIGMKSPIKKLSGLGLTRHHAHPSPAQLDELSGFPGYMQYMKDCCDSLLSPTVATANSAYGFS